MRLTHSRSFHHRQGISACGAGDRLGNPERYAYCRQEDQCAGQYHARNCSGTGFRETADDRGFSECWLSQGASHGASPRCRPENHLQLPGPHFAHTSRSSLRGRKGSLRSRTGPGGSPTQARFWLEWGSSAARSSSSKPYPKSRGARTESQSLPEEISKCGPGPIVLLLALFLLLSSNIWPQSASRSSPTKPLQENLFPRDVLTYFSGAWAGKGKFARAR